MDRPLIVKSDKLKEGLSFDLSHEDVVQQLLPAFEKEVLDSDNLNKEKQNEYCNLWSYWHRLRFRSKV